jgi:hypothetical protein
LYWSRDGGRNRAAIEVGAAVKADIFHLFPKNLLQKPPDPQHAWQSVSANFRGKKRNGNTHLSRCGATQRP